MGKGIKKASENQWILGSKTKKVREKVVAEICVVLGVCFFTALEWILGGFGEVLSILGGCQEVPKLVQKRIRAEILFFDRAGAFWVAF